ncbi:DUF1569 domain-containing protein [Niabella sp. CC-SYL272]|uniref:DUF1569 domain-containing protein n=1 Tax=Niabella agricola TaxID=2891571 RepID=UPI001F2CFE12|nr:DUF1569 domain-containing protein [Niabella agricola]MCF3111961.1 DUF1569 domain-containing protein [Niabella agricola]
MKSIFDPETRQEIIRRIDSLTENDNPQWGKMTVTQMVRHCALCEEYYYGKIKISRSFIGRIFGKQAINSILKDEDSTFKKNAPTPPAFRVTQPLHDLESEKLKWKTQVERYSTFDQEQFLHWFFGMLTKEQLGQFIYKHSDHHLKQFNA